MAFMFTSETSKQYMLEEDAVKGFEMAVANGQSRLALSILVDVIHGIMEVLHTIVDEEVPEEILVVEEAKEQVEVKPLEKKKTEQKQESEKEVKNLDK